MRLFPFHALPVDPHHAAASVLLTPAGFRPDEKPWLASLAESLGAQYCGDLTCASTFLVCKSILSAVNTAKYLAALQWGVKVKTLMCAHACASQTPITEILRLCPTLQVVSQQWLVDSAAAGKALPAENYKTDSLPSVLSVPSTSYKWQQAQPSYSSDYSYSSQCTSYSKRKHDENRAPAAPSARPPATSGGVLGYASSGQAWAHHAACKPDKQPEFAIPHPRPPTNQQPAGHSRSNSQSMDFSFRQQAWHVQQPMVTAPQHQGVSQTHDDGDDDEYGDSPGEAMPEFSFGFRQAPAAVNRPQQGAPAWPPRSAAPSQETSRDNTPRLNQPLVQQAPNPASLAVRSNGGPVLCDDDDDDDEEDDIIIPGV